MNASQIADQLLANLKTQLGSTWDALKAEDQMLVTQCVTDAAGLTVAQVAAPSAEAAQITAQLKNIAAGAAADIAGVFWRVAQVGIGAGITALVGMA